MSTIFKNLCIDKRSVYALVIAIEGAGGGGVCKDFACTYVAGGRGG